MLSIKPGVRLLGVRPELVLAMCIARDVYAKFGQNLAVTSVIDGEHSRGSLHYTGAAFDIRRADYPNGLITQLQEALGADFDVVLENNHIHIEFQPKAPY